MPMLRRSSTRVDHASETQLLRAPIDDEILPWKQSYFGISRFSVVYGSAKTPLFNVGCEICGTSIDSVLDETNGVLVLDLPMTFVKLPAFSYRIKFNLSECESPGQMRMIQRIYFGPNDVFVRDARFSRTPSTSCANGWDITWPTNPFKVRIERGQLRSIHQDRPILSDIFYFINDHFLAHHKVTFRFQSKHSAHELLLQSIQNKMTLEMASKALHIATFNLCPPSLQNAAQLLHTATKHRDFNLCQLLLAHGSDINCTDAAKHTALHNAVKSDDSELVWFLLKHGADVNGAVNVTSLTPLHQAIMSGNAAMVELLLHAGAAIGPACILRESPCEAKHCDHETALHLAYVWNQPEIAMMLLTAGADVNDNRGAYPQHSILSTCVGYVKRDEDRIAHVQALLDHGAEKSIQWKNKLGVSAMMYAVKRKLHSVVELFVHYLDTSQSPIEDKEWLLQCAVDYKDRRMVEILGGDATKLLPKDAEMMEEAQYDAIGDHIALAKDMVLHFEATEDHTSPSDYHQAALISMMDNEAWLHDIRATGQITAISADVDEQVDTSNEQEHTLVEAGDDGTMVVTADESISHSPTLEVGSIYDTYFRDSEVTAAVAQLEEPAGVAVEFENHLTIEEAPSVEIDEPKELDDGRMSAITISEARDVMKSSIAIAPIYDAYFTEAAPIENIIHQSTQPQEKTPVLSEEAPQEPIPTTDHGLVDAGDDGTMVVTKPEGPKMPLEVGRIYDSYFNSPSTSATGDGITFDEIDIDDDENESHPTLPTMTA